jgi:hypothetical protein
MIELVDVPALTLRNPWGHLVAHHAKRVENRSWMPPETLDRFLIHAGKGWDRDAAGYVRQRYGIDTDGIPTSAIVAVARLAHGCSSSRWSDTLRCDCGVWAVAGQCHWVLNEVTALAWPVPCSGRQGLWRPPADVLAAVERQINGGAA